MPPAHPALRWAKRTALRTGLARPLAATLQSLGARTLAHRVYPHGSADVVTVALPPLPGGGDQHLAMWALQGQDQVARALRDGGWDAFEAPLPTVVARVMNRWGGCLLDVGANTGLYSLIATAVRDDTTAVAFEPVPTIAGLLDDNMSLNLGGARIRVDQIAVTDSSGTATLHLPPPQADGTIETSASLEADFKEVIETRFEVRTSTLDAAWRDHGSPAVTMVKIDVEGSEAKVLAGAREVISHCRPVLSVEVLDRVDPAPLEAIRAAIRYVDVTLTPTRAVVGSAQVAVVPDAPNHLLVPEDRLTALVQDLREIGLEIVRPS